MAESRQHAGGGKNKAAPARSQREAVDSAEEAAEAERRLARWAAILIPAGTLAIAIGVGVVFSLGPAILVLVGGALLGTIALFWASLRTLSGEAPLPVDLEATAFRTGTVDDLAERKRRVLRALKDLELEHSVGKIDEKDYGTLGDKFRREAKEILRAMDAQVDPLREEAERIAQRYLEKKGLASDAKPAAEDSSSELAAATNERHACPKCETSNELDAAFCKKCGTSLAAKSEEAADASG